MDEIVEERVGDVLIEIINLDRATINEADKLKEKLSEGLANGYVKVVIDMSACEFMDSSFLGVLVTMLKKTTKAGGDLKLVGFKPAVFSMFELTRMFRVFNTYSELKKAVQSFD